MIEVWHHRWGNLIGGDEGADVFFAVIGWCCTLVPQWFCISQTEALMDLNHGVHGSWRQEAALTGLFLDILCLLLQSQVCWTFQAWLGHDVCKVLMKYGHAQCTHIHKDPGMVLFAVLNYNISVEYYGLGLNDWGFTKIWPAPPYLRYHVHHHEADGLIHVQCHLI